MVKQQKEKRLGRGLAALLNDPNNDINSIKDKNAEKLVGSIIDIPLGSIEANPFQPRTQFDEEKIDELAESIKELGLIQPITVRKVDYNKFQLVSGERRFRASQKVGLETIPAYVRIANDQEMLEMALVENIQRQDLDPIEIAISYDRLIRELNLTQEEMSKRVGKKRATITNYLRLLKLTPIVQSGIRDEFISMGHGKAILGLEDENAQIDMYKKIVSENLSVRRTEELVKKLLEQTNEPIQQKSQEPEFATNSREDFRKYLNADVKIKVGKNGRGTIVIPFKSEEDFRRIKELIQEK